MKIKMVFNKPHSYEGTTDVKKLYNQMVKNENSTLSKLLKVESMARYFQNGISVK